MCAPKLLVIDHNPDARLLIVNTLAREFPDASLRLCDDPNAVTLILAGELIDLVVAHCTLEHEGVAMLHGIRRLHRTMPIIVIASLDFRDTLTAAGASAVVTYDAWLNVTRVIAELLHSSDVAAGVH